MGARKDLTGTRREKLVVIRQLEERFTGKEDAVRARKAAEVKYWGQTYDY